MNIEEVAKNLNLTTMEVKELTDQGKLICARPGEHPDYDDADVKEYERQHLLEQMKNILFGNINKNFNRLKFIWNLSKEENDLLTGDLLFSEYYNLIFHDLVRGIVKLAGKKEGYFRKLIKLFADKLSEKKGECDSLVEEISKMFKEVEGKDGVREFRNISEHDLFRNPTLDYKILQDTIEKIHQLFDIIHSKVNYPDKLAVRELIGAENAITQHLVHSKWSKKLKEIYYAITNIPTIDDRVGIEAVIKADWTTGKIVIADKTGKEIVSFGLK